MDYGQLIKAVVSEVQKQHLRQPKIDESICLRWIDGYLDSFDPRHLYFLDSDIIEFRTFVEKLPELASSGKPDLYRLVTERYQERAESALTRAIDRLNGSFDFSTDEEIPLRRKTWPISIDDRDERWRLQLKYELLIEKSNDSTIDNAKSFLRSRYESIRKQAGEITDEQAVGFYLDSFCRTIDPDSGYFTKTEFNLFDGGPLREYSIGLHAVNSNGRSIIQRFGPGFRRESEASSILGCELLAIRDQSGVEHHVPEIHWSTLSRLIMFGMHADDGVTLELYDEVRLRRFSVKWPRK